KRLLRTNSDAEFAFCTGDDKTDEDMFRALYVLPSSPSGEATKEAPLSITLANSSSGSSTSDSAPGIKLGIRPEDIFTTPVGPSSRRTLASWHVSTWQCLKG
ncbi:trehalose-6-phosphate synthase, partial [Pisolithus marmoratus]